MNFVGWSRFIWKHWESKGCITAKYKMQFFNEKWQRDFLIMLMPFVVACLQSQFLVTHYQSNLLTHILFHFVAFSFPSTIFPYDQTKEKGDWRSRPQEAGVVPYLEIVTLQTTVNSFVLFLYTMCILFFQLRHDLPTLRCVLNQLVPNFLNSFLRSEKIRVILIRIWN